MLLVIRTIVLADLIGGSDKKVSAGLEMEYGRSEEDKAEGTGLRDKRVAATSRDAVRGTLRRETVSLLQGFLRGSSCLVVIGLSRARWGLEVGEVLLVVVGVVVVTHIPEVHVTHAIRVEGALLTLVV